MPAMRRLPILLLFLLLSPLPALAEDARVLMLGNSYTQQGALEVRVADALEGAVPPSRMCTPRP